MKRLVFIYNAESGLFNALADFAHKIISPSTYACSLCALTYGNFIMKEEWKNFIRQLPFETVFLYKNEFKKSNQSDEELPAIFLQENTWQLLISADEIKRCNSLPQLKELILSKLDLHDKHHHSYL